MKLAARIGKLEATFTDPTGERGRRIAEGMCPDCGWDHPTFPTNGGPWHCIVCGHRFVLKPGPTCTRECASCRARQARLSPPDAWLSERRARQAFRDLRTSMGPEHIVFAHAWLVAHPDLPGEAWCEALDRRGAPALVRAALTLAAHHVETNVTALLPPSIAEIYLADPDARATAACPGCGYLMPTRSRVRPAGTYHHLGWYVGTCPVCGRGNHQDEQDGVPPIAAPLGSSHGSRGRAS